MSFLPERRVIMGIFCFRTAKVLLFFELYKFIFALRASCYIRCIYFTKLYSSIACSYLASLERLLQAIFLFCRTYTLHFSEAFKIRLEGFFIIVGLTILT